MSALQTSATQIPEPVSNEAQRCYHCGLPLPQEQPIVAEIQGVSRAFCCHGCQSVCQVIHDSGFAGFYRRTPQDAALAPPPPRNTDLELYDLDAVQEEYVDTLEPVRRVHLLVEGIHCAACVWLIEKSLAAIDGVLEARVNLSGKRLLLKWDNRQAKLSQLLGHLGQIGYAAQPFDPESAEGSLQRENRKLLYRMAFAGFGMMNLLWISIALYSGADRGEFRTMFQWVGFALATPTLLYSGLPFYRSAWQGLKNRHLGMDLPIAIGASITYLYSLYVTLGLSSNGHVYWDTLVNFLFVILVGRYLEAISKRQAVSSTQRLLDLQPKVARLIDQEGERLVPVRALKAGDRVRIKPGERIAVDGLITFGRSRIDESMLSGESRPVEKAKGNRVSAGTINGSGALEVEVEGVLKNTALGRIIRLVEEAQASKAPIQCMTDRVVPWFVAATLGLALSTFVYWLNQDIETALMAATAVLIITCPCAFGLATPMSIAVASGLGARHGILVKNGEVLEGLSSIDHFVFDKTGTLTEGRPSLVQLKDGTASWSAGEDISTHLRSRIAQLAAVERYSEHPLAQSIVRFATEHGLAFENLSVEGFESHPGKGVSAIVEGTRLLIGNAALLADQGAVLNPQLDDGRQSDYADTVLHYAIGGEHLGYLTFRDVLRADARQLVEGLRQEGIRLTLLSGDRQATAEEFARQLGGMEVIAEVLPEQKDAVIARLQADGARVAMVGDGVNDAPALVRADVGIAMGCGTDVSIASADIVLMSGELEKVRLAAALARRTLNTIRQNIGISILYNLIMVPLAMAAWVTPLVAAVSMPVSSLLVIGNAARIRTLFRNDRKSARVD